MELVHSSLLREASLVQNSDKYCKKKLFLLISERRRKRVSTILQDDDVLVHQSKVVTSWIRRNGITRLDWPAQSLDLNPIDNLCMVLKKAISKRNSASRTVADLKTDVEEERKIIPKQIVQTFVKSMPRQI